MGTEEDEENQAVGFRAILKRHQESQLNHIERIRRNLPSAQQPTRFKKENLL